MKKAELVAAVAAKANISKKDADAAIAAVAAVVAETKPVPVLRVGVEDTFGKSGPALELLEIFGLNAENICAKAKAAIELKK